MASSSSSTSNVLPTKETSVLKGHEGAVLAVRFNSDGNYCLSCGKDRTIRLWNPHRGLHIKTYKGHARDVRDVTVTGDNSKICSCGGDRNIFYWDVSTGRVIRKFRGHDNEVNSVKFNEYGAAIISAGYDRTVRAWDCRSHSTEPIQVIDTFADSVMSVCLTKTEILAGCVDGTIRTFDIRIGREIVDNLGQSVNCISISNDNNCILASCLDSKLRLLDRSTGELLQEYKGHVCKVIPREHNQQMDVMAFSIASFQPCPWPPLCKYEVEIILRPSVLDNVDNLQSYKMDSCLTNTDAHVVCGSEDGRIFFWDLVEGSVISSFRAHASVVTSVCYHPKESCMITSSVDSTIRVWKT